MLIKEIAIRSKMLVEIKATISHNLAQNQLKVLSKKEN